MGIYDSSSPRYSNTASHGSRFRSMIAKSSSNEPSLGDLFMEVQRLKSACHLPTIPLPAVPLY